MIVRGSVLRPRAPLLTTLLVACLLLIVGLPGTAWADWDPDRFVTLQEKADTQFTGGRYNDALQSYLDLKVMLENALDADEIGDDMREPAKEALGTIKYQIGRCLQLTNDCAEAYAAYRTLESSTSLPPDVRIKVDVRLAESALCLAEVTQEADNFDAVRSNLSKAREYLAKAAPLDTYGKLSPESEAEVKQDLDTAVLRADTVAAAVFDHYSAQVMSAVDADSCQAAQVALSRAKRDIPDSRSQEAEALQKAVADCGVIEGPNEPPPDESGFETPIAAWVIFSVGVATLAGYGVWEVVNIDKVDEYNNARDDCADFQPTCQKALDLADELETTRIVSFSLLGVGGAMTLAGTTWLIIAYSTGSDGPSEPAAGDTSFHVAPTADGAMVSLEWRLP